MRVWIATGTAVGVGAALAGGYVGVVTSALAIDLGIGRRIRTLGPQTVKIGAPRDEVFDLIAAGYLTRQPKAVAAKIRVLERGTDMVLAAHRTPVRGPLVATTVETVRFHQAGANGLPAGPWAGATRRRAVHTNGHRYRHHPGLHRRTRHRPMADRPTVGRPCGRPMGANRRHVTRSDQGRSRAPSFRRCSLTDDMML
jgi:hypothetical protein